MYSEYHFFFLEEDIPVSIWFARRKEPDFPIEKILFAKLKSDMSYYVADLAAKIIVSSTALCQHVWLCSTE